MKLCLVSAIVLATVCGCSSSAQYHAYVPGRAAAHDVNLQAAIEQSIYKQEVADRQAPVKPARVGHTVYNWQPYYLPGTSLVLTK